MMRTLILIFAVMMCHNSFGQTPPPRKTLVAYYSWGGNTEELARQIRSLTGADLFVITPETAYPSDYTACTEQAKRDINAGVRPPILGRVADIQSYDIIFVGTPNWWSTMAPPVATFLTEHDLRGKTVAPFVTHGGGREARCFSDMKKIVPDAAFLEGLAVSGNRAKNAGAEVEKWLRQIGAL